MHRTTQNWKLASLLLGITTVFTTSSFAGADDNTIVKGDLNGDGIISLEDAGPFFQALRDLNGYAKSQGWSYDETFARIDMDEDGDFDVHDYIAFRKELRTAKLQAKQDQAKDKPKSDNPGSGSSKPVDPPSDDDAQDDKTDDNDSNVDSSDGDTTTDTGSDDSSSADGNSHSDDDSSDDSDSDADDQADSGNNTDDGTGSDSTADAGSGSNSNSGSGSGSSADSSNTGSTGSNSGTGNDSGSSDDDSTADAGSDDSDVSSGSGSTGGSAGGSGGSGGGTADSGSGSTDTGSVDTPVDAGTGTTGARFLGMNTSELNYNTRLPVMANVMNQASYRKTEYVRWKDATYRLYTAFNGLDPKYRPQGEYTVEAPDGVVVDIQHKEGNLWIEVYGSEEQAKQVKVWLPGYGPGTEGGTPLFTNEYLELMRPFSMIRFLDWQKINNSDEFNWADRVKVGDTREARDAVPIEWCIALCNESQSDLWIQIPHRANDQYIDEMAKLVAAYLDPNLKVYVEYSNEVWNFNFKQTGELTESGKKRGYNLSEEYGWHAARTVTRFYNAWPGDKDRLVRVLSGQAALHWRILQAFEGAFWYAGYEGDPAKQDIFDAISIAAYSTWMPKDSEVDPITRGTWTAKDLLDWQINVGLHKHHANWYRMHGQTARDFGVSFVAYEGGQHLAAGNRHRDIKHLLVEAQSHPRMYDLYLENARLFERYGGSRLVYFNMASPQDIAWPFGHLDHARDTDNPKWRGVVEYVDSQFRLQGVMFD